MATAVEITDFVTIENQPIVSVGMNFPVSTGVISVTADDLIDAVSAQDDVAIRAPRLKLGHGKQLASVTGQEPSFGQVQNLRYEPADMTLYGDYVNVPAWLAEIMPAAYANRSFEGMQGAETVTGKKWRLVITAVSLLGVSWPGISTLEDLQAAFSPGGPDGVTVINAQASVDDVRRMFYDTVAVGDQYWWWIRDILIDPNEMIVDDDDGSLYRMPYEIADNGDVTLGEPVAVKIEYVNVPPKVAAQIAAQGMIAGRGKAIAAHYSDRAASRIDATQEGESSMDPKLLEKLGLPADATLEDAMAAADKLRAETPPQNPETPPNPPADDDNGEDDAPDEGEPESKTLEQLAADKGLALVDAGTLEQIAAGAQAGADLKAQHDRDERDRTIAAAVKDGKIPPARRDHWATLYDNDPEGTKQTLAAMADVIPVTERGVSSTSGTDGATADMDYPVDWLSPSERERIAAAAGGPGSGRVITERGQ